MRAKTAGDHVGVRKAPRSGPDAGVHGPFPAAAFSRLRLASTHYLMASSIATVRFPFFIPSSFATAILNSFSRSSPRITSILPTP